MDPTPIEYGLIAGATVYLGAWAFYAARARLGRRSSGFLQALAGGILAYLALEAGHAASEYVEGLARPETLGAFLAYALATTAAMASTFYLLARIERALGAGGGPAYTSFIVAVALGVHNVAEGLAIAAALLGGATAQALLFTTGFAVHNAAEGFAIAGPLADYRGSAGRLRLLGLSAMAGLPTAPGAAVYYLGLQSDLAYAVLYSIAAASIVYAMLHVNLSALSKLGGVSSPAFWLALTAGVALAFATESLLLFAGLGA